MSDEVPGSFHPAIAGRERPMAELTDTVRRSHRPGGDQHRPARRPRRRGGPAPIDRRRARRPRPGPSGPPLHRPARRRSGRPTRPRRWTGPCPMTRSSAGTTRSPSRWRSRSSRPSPSAPPCSPPPTKVGPGWVHGAALAATFDIVLTAANHLSGSAGPTVWLTIRFRRPTLVGVEARFEAEVVANDGRRVTSQGSSRPRRCRLRRGRR